MGQDEVDPDDPNQPRWYQIEVLLFRNLSTAAQSEEYWPTQLDVRSPHASYAMPGNGSDSGMLDGWQAPDGSGAAAGNQRVEYRSLAASSAKMSAIRDRLQQRRDYKVLALRSWQQALTPAARPVYLHVSEGEQYADYSELEGYIGFSLKRYLHVDTELWWGDYSAPDPQLDRNEDVDFAAGLADLPPETWQHRRVARGAHLQEQRRMRSGEVHYFDHPLVGMMVLISPVPRS
jgi:hypothetical protein